MSGYQSIKRYLGETSLERKCRILFGVAMIVLIGGAFWGAFAIAENLIKNENRRHGRDSISSILLKIHWDSWEHQRGESERQELQQLQRAISADLINQKYTLLTTDDNSLVTYLEPDKEPRVLVATDPDEVTILQSLRERYEQQQASMPAGHGRLEGSARLKEEPAGPASREVIEPVFEERLNSELGQYIYYQPIYYTSQTCIDCHSTRHALSAAEAGTNPAPFRVVKITMPYKQTENAINSTWAILFAAAIATVALAMAALYFIVKYVIVKPLKHLRDVSENISKGDMSARAMIQTNDEFEELAASFNKMLTNLGEKENQLRTVNEELDGKVDQLAQLNMRLYETNRVKSDFLANMSHELRTPLNSIIGFSEVLQGIDSLSDKQKRYAQNIQKSGRLLLEMINDILDLAKMEAGRMDVRPTEFRIESVVNAQCDMVRSLTEEKNIDLSTAIAPNLPPLFQDQAKVQQILTNLLSNAIKFTPDGGRIVVRAGPNERGMFEMSVADTGVGIAPAERELIFEKFRQGTIVFNGDGLTREYSGTGLGLSIVKELCKLLGGEISFDSQLGLGSTFRVQLPWQLTQLPRSESPLSARIDDLTKPRRADYAATN